MKWISVMLVLFLLSCANRKGVGEYVYLEHNCKIGSIIVHTDKDCGTSAKTLCNAGELYQTADYSNGQWTFRYRGCFNTPLAFCAKCVSPTQMEIIVDSICSKQEKLDSESIQQLIDELQEMKMQSLQREASASRFDRCTKNNDWMVKPKNKP